MIPSEFENDKSIQQKKNLGLTRQTVATSVFFIILASLATHLHYSRRDQSMKPYIDTSSFYPELNPKIYAGQIHYSRVPVEYWQHRIQMIKAMGLNALSVYIMWNYHEIEKGKFDFETGNKNLHLFLQLAQKHQMKVLIRPGPYVCAEWDFGGLPARLLLERDLEIRSMNPKFMAEVEIYFAAVAPIIKQHIWTVDEPQKCIIMLQIQNQYGFYGSNIDYILELRKIWRKLHVVTAQYYVDWFINIRKSHWKGANIGLNDILTQFQIDYIKTTLEPKGMVFGGEIYTGWMTYWHLDQFVLKDPVERVRRFQFLMSHNLSYSMYMAHGGTSFGLNAGANARYTEELSFGSQLTSYDYDSPINEQGSSTPKYKIFRQSILKYATWQVPEVPAPIPMKKIPNFRPTLQASIFQNINWNKPTATSNKPIVFQSPQLRMFHLGVVFYVFTVKGGFKETFITQVHDLGYVYINRQFLQVLDRTKKRHNKLDIQCKGSEDCEVIIMVEAMGHINYDLSMQDDYKGIISFKSQTTPNLQLQWKMYNLPINTTQFFNWRTLNKEFLKDRPALFHTTIQLTNPADTYLNMKKYTKGYIWVNGYNLGRFWSVGPQFKLFCPGVWLKNGTNQIYVLDLRFVEEGEIRGELTLKDDEGNF